VESQKVLHVQPTTTQGVSDRLRAVKLAHIGHAHFEGARNSKTAREPGLAMTANKRESCARSSYSKSRRPQVQGGKNHG